MNHDLKTSADRHTEIVGGAVHQLGKALLVASLVGLVATLILGAPGLALAGLVGGWYLFAYSVPTTTTSDDEIPETQRRFVVDE